jgi:hypothetical protein
MRSRPTSSRRLFALILALIAAVFMVGRMWLAKQEGSGATEASLIPTEAAPAPVGR